MLDANIAVKYVGKKKFALDTVAKSGQHWDGNGDVKLVTAPQAAILTAYPDQWELDVLTDEALIAEVPQVEVVNSKGKAEFVSETALKGPLEKMSHVELLAFAKCKYGKVLDHKQSRKLLLDEVESIVNSSDPV